MNAFDECEKAERDSNSSDSACKTKLTLVMNEICNVTNNWNGKSIAKMYFNVYYMYFLTLW